MKRLTFVLVGIVGITASILMSQTPFKNKDNKTIKVDVKKHQFNKVYH